jgi:hypothetical protein
MKLVIWCRWCKTADFIEFFKPNNDGKLEIKVFVFGWSLIKYIKQECEPVFQIEHPLN